MEIIKYTTNKQNNEFFKKDINLKFEYDDERETELITLFPEIDYQTIDGFGGAFTEAGGYVYSKLSDENKEKVINAYFDKKDGINYNYQRTHINSCDFSLDNYCYVEENDNELKTFDISRDKKYLIPFIQDAKKTAGFKLFASPWSPPAFMKTNNMMNCGGKLKQEYKNIWAEYFEKYINEYRKLGLNIFAVTCQNEPKACQRWDSCQYSKEEESDFINNYLSPLMKKIGVEVFCWDHNKERIIERAKEIIGKNNNDNVSGIAFHWYSGDYFQQLEIFHKLYPNKKLIMSECCNEYSLNRVNEIHNAERYAHEIIGDFNNYCNAFCDWNMLLDSKGGPNHVGNYCEAPIMVDIEKQELIFKLAYFYIGHFSKFIESGAIRIGCSVYSSDIGCLAVKNKKEIVLVVLNKTDNQINYNIKIGNQSFRDSLMGHSICTYTII